MALTSATPARPSKTSTSSSPPPPLLAGGAATLKLALDGAELPAALIQVRV
jgi:hypothetical protein